MANIAATLSLNVPAITALCKGDPGSSILNGVNNPSPAIGNEGDFFINTTTYVIFGPKTGGLWGVGTILNNNALAPNWNSVYSQVNALSSNWQNSWTTLLGNSSKWTTAYTTVTGITAVTTVLQNNSSVWMSTYGTVSALSATWSSGATGSVYTTVNANSALWSSTYTTVNAFSATWGSGGPSGPAADLQVRALTSNWQNTYLTNFALSGRWTSTFTTVSGFSGRWESSYTTVNNNSANWNSGYSGYLTLQNISAGLVSTESTVRGISSQWTSSYNYLCANSANFDWTYNHMITGIGSVSAINWDITYVEVLSPYDPSGGFVPGLLVTNSQRWTSATLIVEERKIFWDTAVYYLQMAFLTGWQLPYVQSNSTFQLIPIGTNTGTFGLNLNTSVTDITASLPHYSSQINWPVGTRFEVLQLGTSRVYVSGGTNITINSENNLRRTRTRYTTANLLKTAQSGGVATWVLFGDLASGGTT